MENSFFMLSPNWNESKSFQARNRIFRSTSHADKIAEKTRLIEEYNVENNASVSTENLNVNVEVFNMVSLFPQEHMDEVAEIDMAGDGQFVLETKKETRSDGTSILTRASAKLVAKSMGVKTSNA